MGFTSGPETSGSESSKARRGLTILGGFAISLLAFMALFWLLAFFVPRFLRASGNGRVRFVLIGLMAALLFLNFLKRRRGKARR